MSGLNENYFRGSDDDKKYVDIDSLVSQDEQILWRGKPKKSAFILFKILSMTPIALLWLAIDGGFIYMLCRLGSQMPLPLIIGLCVFFAFHLLPVWIWISHIITANRQHKNLEYAFTDKRIIVRSGVIGIDFKNVYYADIISVNLKVGLFDKICKVGDIYINSVSGAVVLYDIENCYFITNKLQEITRDLKLDAAFPNDLRPKTNKGYTTAYTKDKD